MTVPLWGDPGEIIAADGDAARALVRRLLGRPAWMTDAACRRPEHQRVNFFPGRGAGAHLPALAVCRQCPTLDQCTTWILDVETGPGIGIVAGMTGRQRLELRQRLGRA